MATSLIDSALAQAGLEALPGAHGMRALRASSLTTWVALVAAVLEETRSIPVAARRLAVSATAVRDWRREYVALGRVKMRPAGRPRVDRTRVPARVLARVLAEDAARSATE